VSDSIKDMIDRLTDRQRHEFALTCARRVQRMLFDSRSVAALDVRDRWLRGDASDMDMVMAWSAALAKADAERKAAPEAADEARTAAWDAELALQSDELERMLREGGDQ
jgi:hypothetical protein